MKQPLTSRLLIAFAAVAVAAALSACGAKEVTKPVNGAGQQNGASGGQSASTDQKEQISVYFTDEDMADLNEQKAEIHFADAEGKLEAAFAALQQKSSEGRISLWEHVQLKSVKIDGGAVTFDIHLPDEARLGAPGEELALDAIEKTMFQFDDVKSIDILVDGEKLDSLMGHEELDHPITKP